MKKVDFKINASTKKSRVKIIAIVLLIIVFMDACEEEGCPDGCEYRCTDNGIWYT